MRPKLSVVENQKFKKVGENLYIRTATQIYYVRKTFRRLRIPDLFESTRETQIGKAKAKRDALIQGHLAKYLGGEPTLESRRAGMAIGKIIDEILETVTPRKRAGTQAMHRIYLGEIKKEWGSFDINRITLASWTHWLEEFRRRKKRKTFNDYVKHMNIVLRYAYQQRYAHHLLTIPGADPMRETAGRAYTPEEVQALWDNMGENLRDQFVLCFECCMRLREALYLTWDRVDLAAGVITLRAQDVKTGSKTGKGRSFALSERALARLRARREKMQSLGISSPYVFPSRLDPRKPQHSNKKAWATAKEKAKIKGRARWHDLRHSALTTVLLETQVNPVLVSEYAGVSLKTIQRVYLHSTHEKTAAVSKAIKIQSDSVHLVCTQKKGEEK